MLVKVLLILPLINVRQGVTYHSFFLILCIISVMQSPTYGGAIGNFSGNWRNVDQLQAIHGHLEHSILTNKWESRMN